MKRLLTVKGTTFSLLGFDKMDSFTIYRVCGNIIIYPKALEPQPLRFVFDDNSDDITTIGAINYIKETYGITEDEFVLEFVENPATHSFLCTKKAPTTL